jgi:hypothetical protein
MKRKKNHKTSAIQIIIHNKNIIAIINLLKENKKPMSWFERLQENCIERSQTINSTDKDLKKKYRFLHENLYSLQVSHA